MNAGLGVRLAAGAFFAAGAALAAAVFWAGAFAGAFFAVAMIEFSFWKLVLYQRKNLAPTGSAHATGEKTRFQGNKATFRLRRQGRNGSRRAGENRFRIRIRTAPAGIRRSPGGNLDRRCAGFGRRGPVHPLISPTESLFALRKNAPRGCRRTFHLKDFHFALKYSVRRLLICNKKN
ncbi:hypothetical protein ACFX58_08630 [Sphingomonas sp. NCPPB 2930]